MPWTFSFPSVKCVAATIGIHLWIFALLISLFLENKSKYLSAISVFPSSENIKNVPNGTIVGLNKVGIEVKCSDGIVTLKLIQPEGKKKMEASSYLNGLKNKEELIGKVLV